MTTENKEKFKTIILILLVFSGINYVLITYLIGPKVESFEMAKENFYIQTEGQSINESLMSEKESIIVEVEQLKVSKTMFKGLVSNNIDTIQLAYDFYTYAESESIEGMNIEFNISEVTSFLKQLDERKEEDEIAVPILDETGNTMIVEEIEEEEEDPTYLTIHLKVDFETRKDQLDQVLDSLPHASNESIYGRKVIIQVDSRQVEGREENEELEEEFISLTVDYLMFIDVQAFVQDTNQRKSYEFYEKEKANDLLQELFEATKESSELVDEISLSTTEVTTGN